MGDGEADAGAAARRGDHEDALGVVVVGPVAIRRVRAQRPRSRDDRGAHAVRVRAVGATAAGGGARALAVAVARCPAAVAGPAAPPRAHKARNEAVIVLGAVGRRVVEALAFRIGVEAHDDCPRRAERRQRDAAGGAVTSLATSASATRPLYDSACTVSVSPAHTRSVEKVMRMRSRRRRRGVATRTRDCPSSSGRRRRPRRRQGLRGVLAVSSTTPCTSTPGRWRRARGGAAARGEEDPRPFLRLQQRRRRRRGGECAANVGVPRRREAREKLLAVQKGRRVGRLGDETADGRGAAEPLAAGHRRRVDQLEEAQRDERVRARRVVVDARRRRGVAHRDHVGDRRQVAVGALDHPLVGGALDTVSLEKGGVERRQLARQVLEQPRQRGRHLAARRHHVERLDAPVAERARGDHQLPHRLEPHEPIAPAKGAVDGARGPQRLQRGPTRRRVDEVEGDAREDLAEEEEVLVRRAPKRRRDRLPCRSRGVAIVSRVTRPCESPFEWVT